MSAAKAFRVLLVSYDFQPPCNTFTTADEFYIVGSDKIQAGFKRAGERIGYGLILDAASEETRANHGFTSFENAPAECARVFADAAAQVKREGGYLDATQYPPVARAGAIPGWFRRLFC